MLDVGVGHSDFDVLDVRRDADDAVDDRLLEPERRNDHSPGLRTQIVHARQLELNLGFVLLKFCRVL